MLDIRESKQHQESFLQVCHLVPSPRNDAILSTFSVFIDHPHRDLGSRRKWNLERTCFYEDGSKSLSELMLPVSTILSKVSAARK